MRMCMKLSKLDTYVFRYCWRRLDSPAVVDFQTFLKKKIINFYLAKKTRLFPINQIRKKERSLVSVPMIFGSTDCSVTVVRKMNYLTAFRFAVTSLTHMCL